MSMKRALDSAERKLSHADAAVVACGDCMDSVIHDIVVTGQHDQLSIQLHAPLEGPHPVWYSLEVRWCM